MFGAIDISTSALTAHRIRMNTIANNIANVSTTRAGVDADGNVVPYRRRHAVFAEARGRDGEPRGVKVVGVFEDMTEFRRVYDPDHPDAVDGYVRMPNVDMITEMVDALEAVRAYEANVTVMNTTKQMVADSLRLLA